MVDITGVDPLSTDAAPPLDAPLYGRPEGGWTYRDTVFSAVTFETDASAAAELLPPGLILPQGPPLATMLLLECRDSVFGAYNELKVELVAEFDGEAQRYCPYILVGAMDGVLAPDAALAMGREVMGVPKKVANISTERGEDRLEVVAERPLGERLCALSFAWGERVDPATVGLAGRSPAIHLRLIPSVDGGRPSVSELVRWDTRMNVHSDTVREGDAAVRYGRPSPEDPWHRLSFGRQVRALTWRGDLTIPPTAAVVRNYLGAPLWRRVGA